MDAKAIPDQFEDIFIQLIITNIVLCFMLNKIIWFIWFDLICMEYVK